MQITKNAIISAWNLYNIVTYCNIMSQKDWQQSDQQEWFTVVEAANFLRVTRQTIYRYMEDGSLPYYVLKSGGGRRIKRADLESLLEPPAKPNDEALQD